jgi:CheY-like chemotaxis protein
MLNFPIISIDFNECSFLFCRTAVDQSVSNSSCGLAEHLERKGKLAVAATCITTRGLKVSLSFIPRRVILLGDKIEEKKMKKRILVINDTQEILDLFRTLLEEEGYEVILSGSPLQKLTEVEQLRPDLIILDILFRDEKTGWQMIEMLRTKRTTASIPIVICSAALRDVREQEGYLNSQGIHVVYKPFDIDVLLDTVKAAIEVATRTRVIQEKHRFNAETDSNQ